MTNKEIGEMIRLRRESRGMTQAQLANAINMSESAIAMYESGKRRPKDTAAEALADVFNVPKWSIFYREDEMIPKYADDDNSGMLRREALRRDPKRRLLFDIAENGTDLEVDAVVSLFDVLRKTNKSFYDGDDPA